MRKKPLEICLYVAGAGAFGVFLRWLENQLAFNELGLADPSAFHILVPAFVVACAVVFRYFIRQMQRQRLYIPEETHAALGSSIRLHVLLRRAAGVVMLVGGLLLFAKSETEKYPGMLRLLAALAALSGIGFSFFLSEAEREEPRPAVLCPLSLLPALLYAVWLVYSYRENSINSVPLSYGLDMLTAIVAMVSFFRLAGLPFGTPKGPEILLGSMLTGTLCIMSLADERLMGMEIILLATAGQMLLITWILVQNLQQGEKKQIKKKDDGFEHLE